MIFSIWYEKIKATFLVTLLESKCKCYGIDKRWTCMYNMKGFLLQFRPEMVNTLYRYAKFQYECGNYSGAAEYLYFVRVLVGLLEFQSLCYLNSIILKFLPALFCV